MDGEQFILKPAIYRPILKEEVGGTEEKEEAQELSPLRPPRIRKPTISVDFDTFKVTEVRDCDDPSLIGRGVFNTEEQTLFVYLAPHMTEFELVNDKFMMHVEIGVFNMPLREIGDVTEDPTMLPTCKYLVPNKKQLGSELPSNWKFVTGFMQESCVCPARGHSDRNPGICTPCSQQNVDLSGCNEFEPLLDEPVLEITNLGQAHIISKHFSPPRVVTFVVDTDETVRLETMEEVNKYMEEKFEMDSAIVTPIEKPKNSYFEKVFA